MIRDIVETAIKMETDSMAFYEEAASKTVHPFGREMFRGFIKDEYRHLRMLRELFSGAVPNFEFASPRETVKTIFTELKDSMMEKVKALESEKDAVKIAAEFEKEGYEYYKKAAASAETPVERELFEKLAHEENEHFRLLSETYSFLDDTGNWYMYEEKGILEG